MNSTVCDGQVATVDFDCPANQLTSPFLRPPIKEKLNSGFSVIGKRCLLFVGISQLVGGLLMSRGMNMPVSLPHSTGVDWRIIATMAGVFCTTFAAIGLVAAGLYFWLARSSAAALQDMKEGRYVALWRCKSDQWGRFVKAEAIETTSKALLVGGVVFCFIAVPAVTFGVCFQLATLALAGSALAIAFGLIAGYVSNAYQLDKLNRWIKQPWFTVIGMEGLYWDNQYRPYSSFYGNLHRVVLDEIASMNVLVFTFRNRTKNGYSEAVTRIPVPEGLESAAKDVVAMLR